MLITGKKNYQIKVIKMKNRILIVVGSGSGKTNVLLKLIKHQRQFA